MSLRSSGIYHDGTYLRNHPTWHEEDAPYKAEDILTFLEKHSLRPATICEVGCGSGGVLERYPANSTVPQNSPAMRSPSRPSPCAGVRNKITSFCSRQPPGRRRLLRSGACPGRFRACRGLYGFSGSAAARGAHKIFRIPLNISVESVLFKSRPILHARQSLRPSALLHQRDGVGHASRHRLSHHRLVPHLFPDLSGNTRMEKGTAEIPEKSLLFHAPRMGCPAA